MILHYKRTRYLFYSRAEDKVLEYAKCKNEIDSFMDLELVMSPTSVSYIHCIMFYYA